MKYIETEKWCTSSNGEWFGDADYSNREEAIAECKANQEDSYIGRAVRIEFTESDIDVSDHLQDVLSGILCDEVGDVAENWDMPNEDMIELDKRVGKVVIDFFNERDLQPSCFMVTDIEEVQV